MLCRRAYDLVSQVACLAWHPLLRNLLRHATVTGAGFALEACRMLGGPRARTMGRIRGLHLPLLLTTGLLLQSTPARTSDSLRADLLHHRGQPSPAMFQALRPPGSRYHRFFKTCVGVWIWGPCFQVGVERGFFCGLWVSVLGVYAEPSWGTARLAC